MRRGAHLLRLDIVRANDLVPLLGVLDDELAELGGRHRLWNAADAGELSRQPGIGEDLAGAERVRLAVERLEIPHAPGTGKPFVTISVGMAALDAASPTSIDDWLRRSDTALSTAKALGRNRVEVEARQA